MLSELSACFVGAPPDQVGKEIERVLEFIVDVLHVDRVSVYEASEKDPNLIRVHSHRIVGSVEAPPEIKSERLPWLTQTIFKGGMICFSQPGDLPVEAEAEKEFFSDQAAAGAPGRGI